jgi:hypothetical protein
LGQGWRRSAAQAGGLCDILAVALIIHKAITSGRCRCMPRFWLRNSSPCFGQVINEADVPTSSNEPHHLGMNNDETVRGHPHSNYQVTHCMPTALPACPID